MTARRRPRLRPWMTNTVTALVAGLGGLSLGVGSNALYGLLTGNGSAEAAQLRIALVALVAAPIFAGILVPLLRRVFAPRYPGLRAAHFTHEVPRRPALIALVSLPRDGGGNPAETAMLYHLQRRDAGGQPLERCWLLATEQSASEVQRLREAYPAVTCDEIRLAARAAQDPSFAYAAVRGAFAAAQALGLRSDQVIADATGGTKTMTIGMALACRELGLSMEYISADYRNNDPVLESMQVIAVDMSETSAPVAASAAAVLAPVGESTMSISS